MHEAVASMMARYNCQTSADYTNALREIMQEIVLLGLWRSKFFEKSAFYGGTSLRVLVATDSSGAYPRARRSCCFLSRQCPEKRKNAPAYF